MKRLLLVAALSAAGLLFTTEAQAQRTDTTYVKPQLPTGPPMAPPPRPATPAPAQPTPAQPQQPVPQQPVRPSGGIDDDGRTAQPLPGTPRPQPATPAPVGRPTGIDDDGRPAQPLPTDGSPVPGAVTVPERKPSKYFLYTNFNLGLSSSYDITQFNVGASPAIGYRVTDKFAIGPGITYTFNNFSLSRDAQAVGYPSNISCNNIGVKAFAQYIVYKQFFVHAEYEVTRAQLVPSPIVLGGPYKFNRTITSPLAGVGYRSPLGERAALDITVLYNFNDGIENIYGQPVIRFSLLFDLGK
ncbi:hypothetical protein GCM10027048_03350 [Hymenobacter coalescens]